MKSISNEDGQRLTSLMLESVPASHHGDILKSCAVEGPVVTFFNKVFYFWSQEQKKEALVRVKDKNKLKFIPEYSLRSLPGPIQIPWREANIYIDVSSENKRQSNKIAAN